MNAALSKPECLQQVSGRARYVQNHRACGDNDVQQYQPFRRLSATPWPDLAGCRTPVAGPSADDRQAAYFLVLFAQHLRRIDRRIHRCRNAITEAAAAGDVENVRGFRRLLVVEEQERRTVEALVDNLRRRFMPNG